MNVELLSEIPKTNIANHQIVIESVVQRAVKVEKSAIEAVHDHLEAPDRVEDMIRENAVVIELAAV